MMKGIFNIYYNAIYFNLIALIVAILFIVISALDGFNPYTFVIAGVFFVLSLFESAMNYDEFKNTYGKICGFADDYQDIKRGDNYIKKNGEWL